MYKLNTTSVYVRGLPYLFHCKRCQRTTKQGRWRHLYRQNQLVQETRPKKWHPNHFTSPQPNKGSTRQHNRQEPRKGLRKPFQDEQFSYCLLFPPLPRPSNKTRANKERRPPKGPKCPKRNNKENTRRTVHL